MNRNLNLALFLALAGLACAPDADSIDGLSECTDCRIELAQVVALTSEDAAGEARYPASLARSASGRYFVAPTHVPGTVAMYDASGAFIGSLGRRGRGPGEMYDVMSVDSWLGDSVVVLHDRNQFLVYGADTTAPRAGQFKSTSFVVHHLTPASDSSVLAMRGGSMGGEDQPIREFSLTGAPVRGYGESVLMGEGRDHAAMTTFGDTIWAARYKSYEIDVFLRSTGEKIRTVTRHVDWIPPGAAPDERNTFASALDITRDPSGRLWILLRRPSVHFNSAPRTNAGSRAAPARGAGGPGLSMVGLLQRDFDHVLEVLDPERGTVIATRNLDDRVYRRFLDGEHLYGYEEHPDTGSLSVVLWRLSLTNGS